MKAELLVATPVRTLQDSLFDDINNTYIYFIPVFMNKTLHACIL